MSEQQRLNALIKANVVRTKRKDAKFALGIGETSWREALDDPDPQTFTLMELLCLQQGWGKVRADVCLKECGLRGVGDRPVSELTAPQREWLADYVGMRTALPKRIRYSLRTGVLDDLVAGLVEEGGNDE